MRNNDAAGAFAVPDVLSRNVVFGKLVDEGTEEDGIEEVVDLGAKYKDVVVAKVVTCEKLEGSDHLNITKLDDNGVTPDIERDENGYIQVVCGAPNVRAGIVVAWLPPRYVTGIAEMIT